METEWWLAIINAVAIACIITGYLLKTRILKQRLEQIVKFIMDDIKDHDRVDWQALDSTLEKLLKERWSEVIKRGVVSYKIWVRYKPGERKR